ncbi:hypothetical protein D9M68_443980 [compost metagenome]
MFSNVVLPEPVPPETTRFLRIFTQSARNWAMAPLNEPAAIRSGMRGRCRGNLRMVRLAPFMATGGIMACTRDPSESRASTIGELSSMRRPKGVTMRSIAQRTDCSLVNAA